MSENTESAKRTYLAEIKLELLEAGGVEDWEWYSESLAEAEYPISDEEKLNFLENGGVDNWTWYGESLGRFNEYRDYLDTLPFDEADGYYEWLESVEKAAEAVVEEIPAEPVIVPREFTESELLIVEEIKKNSLFTDNHDVENIFARIVETGIWRRNAFPAEYDSAIKFGQKQDSTINFKEIARGKLIELLVKNGKLKTLITETLESF